jgi:hypothetical protein
MHSFNRTTNYFTVAFCALLFAAADSAESGETIRLTAKETLAAVEMDHGDQLQFTLQCGRTVSLVLEDTRAAIVERVEPGGIVYQFSCDVRIDGQPVTLRRFVCSQECFYEALRDQRTEDLARYGQSGVRSDPGAVSPPGASAMRAAQGGAVRRPGRLAADLPRGDASLVGRAAGLYRCGAMLQRRRLLPGRLPGPSVPRGDGHQSSRGQSSAGPDRFRYPGVFQQPWRPATTTTAGAVSAAGRTAMCGRCKRTI